MSFTRRPGSGRPRQSWRRPPHRALTKDIWDCSALYVLPLIPTHRRLRLEWFHARGNWTAAECNRVVFSDESSFYLSSDDNRVRVWRSRGERLNPAFDLQRHIVPTAGMIVWGSMAYNTRSPLVLIRGTMTAQRYVHGILNPHVLPLMQRLPGAIFQQDNSQPRMARVSPLCYYPSLACPIPRFVSNQAYLGSFGMAHTQVGHPISLNELEARVQQIWKEMPQDIIQNLYASMPDHSSSERDSSFSFCGLPASVGPCKEFEVRYHYDMFTDKCQTFNYSGCEGNRNNFKTKEACEKECRHQSSENDDNICRLPAEKGPCEAFIPRYFFDHTKGSCEIFVYGGCKGNANNFETLKECETRCLRKTSHWLEYRTPDWKVWVRCPMPPNTLRVPTEYVLVKSLGPNVLWAESRVQGTGEHFPPLQFHA
ncbi:kunitz-type serine protease inhibitor bitisilin-3 [Trichonephila clavipes]|uniref:Kunitz-type serine protease inhibitor bitisilin-3 n=1 Tax=Trichonephila clavipes TaxID=2585209 RepID=A0A8X6SJJ6_TRICX|nr:kunitz-type serine protease inhibitor bitisilin-3 [Trichonephila clavipes]